MSTGQTVVTSAFDQSPTPRIKKTRQTLNILELGERVILKAICKDDFYTYENLAKHFPDLKSVHEFISSKNFLGSVSVEIVGPFQDISEVPQDEKLSAVLSVLAELKEYLMRTYNEYSGSDEFKPFMVKDKFFDKTLNVEVDPNSSKQTGIAQSETSNENLRLELGDKDWYTFNDNYGTSEEKYFVRFFDSIVKELKRRYKDVFLIRNERHIQIYNFQDGKPIEPDFVLMLEHDDNNTTAHYQVFIEPKGSHLLDQDAWKEQFLRDIKEKHIVEQLWKSKEYIVWGLPFYNEKERKSIFVDQFRKDLLS